MAKPIKKLRLMQLPETKDKSVIVLEHPGTAFSFGDEGTDLQCGLCDAILVSGAVPGRITGVVIQCGKCKMFNDATY